MANPGHEGRGSNHAMTEKKDGYTRVSLEAVVSHLYN